jgi:hypothetical protein
LGKNVNQLRAIDGNKAQYGNDKDQKIREKVSDESTVQMSLHIKLPAGLK